jgi:hypothetical protein
VSQSFGGVPDLLGQSSGQVNHRADFASQRPRSSVSQRVFLKWSGKIGE